MGLFRPVTPEVASSSLVHPAISPAIARAACGRPELFAAQVDYGFLRLPRGLDRAGSRVLSGAGRAGF